MKRYSYFADDLVDWLWWAQSTMGKTYKGQWVDTDQYDIIPKQTYLDSRIKEKEEQMKSLQEEIDQLKSKTKALKTG